MVVLLVSMLMAVQVHAEKKMYFVHTDHLGATQMITDKDQNVVWRGYRKPFGEVVEVGTTVDQQGGFPGQYLDLESGLFYNYYRDYDPSTGRYVQADPRGINADFSDPQRKVAAESGIPIPDWDDVFGLNHSYNYANQSPLIYDDPTGELVPLIPVVNGAITAHCIFNCYSNPGVGAVCNTLSDNNTNEIKAAACAAACAVAVTRVLRAVNNAYKANTRARTVASAKNAAEKRRPKKPKKHR